MTDTKALADEFSAYEDEDTLEEQLGLRLAAANADNTAAVAMPSDFSVDAEHLGLVDDAKELGQRFYKRVSRELHATLCGAGADDSKDRQDLLNAIGGNKTAVVAAISALLVSALGMMPAVAAIAAALLFKRVFEPFGEEFCKLWGEKLKAGGQG